MNNDGSWKYKETVLDKLNTLKPIFAKAAIGDFSDNVVLPDTDDEFAELYCGIQTMLEVIREQFSEMQDIASHYSNILESTLDGIIVEENEHVVYVNKSFAEIFGYESNEMIGLHVSKLLTPEDSVRMSDYGKKRLRGERVPAHYEFKGVHKNGSLLNLEASVDSWAIPGKDGIVTVVRDITNRLNAEEQIRQSLIEKEILLKEIHHRVKNNLQIIKSLLSLQLKFVKDKTAANFISESMNRITSISIIHELFYKYKDITKIEFNNYISKIVSHLFNVYGVDSSKISAEYNLTGISLGIDTAIPCGLIINELLTNCLKYAFPDVRKGKILIEMKKNENDTISLILKDDGIGMPDNFDMANPPSMGMQLVLTLVKQMDGNIELERNKGTKFVINFPATKYTGPN
jgi:PAS domain S-box-containing protein